MLRNYLDAVVLSFITIKLFSFSDWSGLASAILIGHYVANELIYVANATSAKPVLATTSRIAESKC